MASVQVNTMENTGPDIKAPTVTLAEHNASEDAATSNEKGEWPYTAGFETDYEQHTPIELEVTGHIPAYAAGILYRTGPGNYKVKTDKGDTFESHHWFDGLTTVHRFEIKDSSPLTKVLYNSRRTVDELLQHIRKTGSFKDFSFGQKRDPCQSLFKKVMSTFQSTVSRGAAPTAQNVGVTLSANMPGMTPPTPTPHGTPLSTLITKTDANLYQSLDPTTLSPLGLCRQTVLHPDLKGPLSAAHAKTCPLTGDVFNYNLDIGPRTYYRVFRAAAATGKTDVLATIPATGAYLHSLFLTPSAVVLCVWNAHYAARGVSLLLNRNVLDSIAPFDEGKEAVWYVVDRSPKRRGVIATYTSPAFFAFHTVNAWERRGEGERKGEVDIEAEVVAYEDLSVLHRFYYRNLIPKEGEPPYKVGHPKCVPRLRRYRLPGLPLGTSTDTKANVNVARKAEVLFDNPPELSMELPAINPRFSTLPHRYTYGVRDTGKSGFFDGLVKFDAETREIKRWCEHAQTAGEPIFVPAKKGEGEEAEEDEGVLLSVVLDGLKGTSYLLCLDARTMEEMGRASVPGIVGFGFHGLHVPKDRGVYNGGD